MLSAMKVLDAYGQSDSILWYVIEVKLRSRLSDLMGTVNERKISSIHTARLYDVPTIGSDLREG